MCVGVCINCSVKIVTTLETIRGAAPARHMATTGHDHSVKTVTMAKVPVKVLGAVHGSTGLCYTLNSFRPTIA